MNIMNIEHISKIFGEKTIFDDASIGIQEGDKIGIVGINGTGKSTLLRMIAGDEVPDSGNIIRQNQLKLAWLPQEPKFPENATILSYAGDDETGWKVQSNLSQLGIMDYSMPIDQLSGGQKRKVALAKVLAQDFDVLLLDEPGNNLDIPTLAVLEDYLSFFSGIVITVSHDRYFLDNVVDRIFEFDGEGHLTQYEGGYTDYKEAKRRRENQAQRETSAPKVENQKKATGKDWKQKRPEKLRFTFKEKKEFETIDDEIAKLEEKLEELEENILANATNSAKLYELTTEKEKTEAKLEEKMERWVYLNDLAERIEVQRQDG